MSAAPIQMRSPCGKCGGAKGVIRTTGGQDCVYCLSCGAYAYNRPRSDTGGRRSMPSVKAIHRYWMTEQTDIAFAIFNQCDIGEPSCYCCGLWDYNAPEGNEFTSFYERCHIVDHALGGSESVDNLILLCRTCHWQMPRIAPGTPLETVGKWIEAQRSMWIAQRLVRGHRIAHEKDTAA